MSFFWKTLHSSALAALIALLGLGGFGTLGCDDEPSDGDADGDGDSDGDGDADSDSDSDADGDDEILEVTILQTSDIHNRASGYGPQAEYTPLDTTDDDPTLGGFARLAALIDGIRDEQATAGVPVIVVDSGDHTMGTIYDMTAEDPLVYQFFGAVGYDAITLGNHEFDWGPSGLAMMLGNALASDTPFDVPIVSSNMIMSEEDGDDDLVEALVESDVIQSKLVLELDNGLRVGILGFVGTNADEDAPTAEPITFEHNAAFMQGLVDEIRDTDQVDMVLALSHSGINDDLESGEDVGLAQGLTGLDVIASGHSHLPTPDAIETDGAIVFQPGEYGEFLSRIDLSYNVTQERVESFDFTLIPVDDSIEGDADVQGMVDAVHAGFDALLEEMLSLRTMDPVVELDFEMERAAMMESGLGSLCADATRTVATWAVAESDDPTPFTFAVVPNGVVRDDIHASADGLVTFSDIFNVLPLGMTPDPANQTLTGWPLMSAYMTAAELRNVCEVPASLAGMVGNSAYLNISGLRCEYDPEGPAMATVTNIYACGNALPEEAGGDNDVFSLDCVTELDQSDETTLYRIVTDLYTILMMDLVATFLPLVPKHADGTPIDLDDPMDLLSERIDIDGDVEGIQELKNWAALLQFVLSLPDDGGTPDVGDMPEAIYGADGAALGRVFPTE